jgi:lamin-B receptor
MPAPTPRRSARLAAAPSPPRRRAGTASSTAHHYEFCGPHLGPAAMLIGLPAVCYALLAVCNDRGCARSLPALLAGPPAWPGLPRPLASWAGFGAVGGWFAAQAAVHLAAPGKVRQGVPLAGGGRLTYKLTGERRAREEP